MFCNLRTDRIRCFCAVAVLTATAVFHVSTAAIFAKQEQPSLNQKKAVENTTEQSKINITFQMEKGEDHDGTFLFHGKKEKKVEVSLLVDPQTQTATLNKDQVPEFVPEEGYKKHCWRVYKKGIDNKFSSYISDSGLLEHKFESDAIIVPHLNPQSKVYGPDHQVIKKHDGYYIYQKEYRASKKYPEFGGTISGERALREQIENALSVRDAKGQLAKYTNIKAKDTATGKTVTSIDTKSAGTFTVYAEAVDGGNSKFSLRLSIKILDNQTPGVMSSATGKKLKPNQGPEENQSKQLSDYYDGASEILYCKPYLYGGQMTKKQVCEEIEKKLSFANRQSLKETVVITNQKTGKQVSYLSTKADGVYRVVWVGEDPLSKNKSTIRYTFTVLKDMEGGGTMGNRPDGIPDLYQVKFTFKLNNNSFGAFSGGTKQMLVQYVTVPKDEKGCYVKGYKVHPSSVPVIKTKKDCSFFRWVDSNGKIYFIKNAVASVRSSKNMTFTAVLVKERITMLPEIEHMDIDDVDRPQNAPPLQKRFVLHSPAANHVSLSAKDILQKPENHEKIMRSILVVDAERNSAGSIIKHGLKCANGDIAITAGQRMTIFDANGNVVQAGSRIKVRPGVYLAKGKDGKLQKLLVKSDGTYQFLNFDGKNSTFLHSGCIVHIGLLILLIVFCVYGAFRLRKLYLEEKRVYLLCRDAE